MKPETYKKRLMTYSLPKLKGMATTNFNAFIRDRDSGEYSLLFQCISCRAYKSIDKMNAGHFYPGTHSATKFDVDNVHGQCVRCNMHLHGNLIEYQKNLIPKIGLKAFKAISWKHVQPCKRNKFDYIEIIMKYKNRVECKS